MLKMKNGGSISNDSATHNEVSNPFGIDFLDSALQNSIKTGRVYGLFGKTGTGKTTLATQFLVKGAENGEKCAIIITDSSAKQYINDFKTLQGFKEHYDNGDIEVIELSDRFKALKESVFENQGNFGKYKTELIDEIRKLVAESGITRLVIDTITPMLIDDIDCISMLIKDLALPRVTVFITGGVLKSDFSFFGYEENVVSGVIKLESDGESTKRATIVKMPGIHDSKPIEYTITQSGIVPAKQPQSILRGYKPA